MSLIVGIPLLVFLGQVLCTLGLSNLLTLQYNFIYKNVGPHS